MPKSSSRGLSIVEMMVTTAIFGLGMLVLTGVMIFLLRLVTQSQARSDEQRQALLIAQKLQRRLAEAPLAGVTLHYPSGSGDLSLAWPTFRDSSEVPQCQRGIGSPIYQAHWIHGLEPRSGEIRSWRRPLPVATLEPLALDVPTLGSWTANAPLSVLCRGIRRWEALDPLSGAPTATACNPLRLSVTTAGKAPFQMEFHVKLLL